MKFLKNPQVSTISKNFVRFTEVLQGTKRFLNAHKHSEGSLSLSELERLFKVLKKSEIQSEIQKSLQSP